MEKNDGDLDFGDWMGRGVGTLVVLAFLSVATVGYYLADGRLSARSELYREAIGAVEEIPDSDQADPRKSPGLVHATGDARVLAGARDELLGAAADAVCIHREVNYYQWREEERNDRRDSGGAVNRTVYVKRWVPRPIDSNRFKMRARDGSRTNVVLADIAPADWPAGRAMLGAFELADAVKTSFPERKPLPVQMTEDQRARLAAGTIAAGAAVRDASMVHVSDNQVYVGRDPGHPAIGDVRVRLTAAWPGRVSVIAWLENGRLDAFTAANGETMAVVRAGDVSANGMLGRLTLVNALKTWGIRIGLAVVFGFFAHILGVVWERRTGGRAYLGVALACVVMCAVWFCHRPGAWSGLAFLPVAAAAAGMWVGRGRRAAPGEEG